VATMLSCSNLKSKGVEQDFADFAKVL